MTRKIKFRAFDKDSSTMLYPEDYSHDDLYLDCPSGEPFLMASISGYDDYSYGIEVRDAIIMQFTGLLDKNGKEIYEGDITEYDTKDRGRRLVKWDIGRGKFFLQGGFDGQIHDTRIIVIGNIYENPELLEE